MRKRRLTGKVAVTMMAAALVLSGCSGGGAGKKDASDGIVTVAAAGPVYPENFNWYGANEAGTAPGLALVYESPFILDPTDPGKLVPRLAESFEMEDDGNTMVFHLREGVMWSDGVEMTADDFVYTYGFVNGDACDDPDKCWASKPPEATDKYTAKIYFHSPEFQQIANYSMYYPIYPAHIWEERDRKTDINEEPVGTGPFTLKNFQPQQMVYEIRDDYWGGKGNGVKEVRFIPMGPIGGVQAQLGRGELDFVEAAAPGVMQDFVQKDEENNHFSVYPGGGSQIITFNTTIAPFDDAAVRRALRDSLDLQAGADLAGVGFTVPSVVGLDTVVYKNTLLPEFAEPLVADVDGAKKELEDAGYTIDAEGNLEKDGKTYPLELRIDNGNAIWMQLGQVFADQWKKNLGLTVGWMPTPTQVFNKESTLGNYAMFASGGISNGNYYQAYAQFSKSNLKEIGDDVIYGNYGRWANETMFTDTKALSSIKVDDLDSVTPLAQEMQKAIAEEAPFIPAMTNTTPILWSSRKWTGFPEPGTAKYIPSATNLNNAIDTFMMLEPAS
ncbi:MAG: ABC transporter substrate-binding protein [Propionibacteriaceae bacterium]|nr:ABC transporter substrate-binding protein [Propionibacteriaceae bacterium]